MKVTLILTVKNEGKTIEKFLDSIKRQTKKPDEIVIVDGGSIDETLKIIESSGLKIKLIKERGNRAVGRNIAIKHSSNKIIACSDAGCILDRKWFEKITNPFQEDFIDVVAGFYKPKTSSIFEKCLATYTCTMSDRLDPQNFLPSSRSIAFKKSAWEKVGGYPDNLDTCEDLVFAKKMKNAGFRFITVKEAFVYWPQRKNILQAAKQFFNYAVGDGKAGYIRKSTPFLFGRYGIGLIFLLYFLASNNIYMLFVMFNLVFLYILWSIVKNYKYVRSWHAFYLLPLLQFTSDIAVILGMIYGRLSRQNKV